MSEDLASGTGVTGADSVLLDAVRPLLAEHAELERALSEPGLHADPARARAVGRRYAELGQVVEAHARLLAAAGDEAAARDLAEDDEESALFAGDLLRMYLRYAERQGWRTEVLDRTESDLGGFKDVAVAVKSRGTPTPGEGVYARLKFEAGVHRVQRVPVTEAQGRIHTSAAGVLVLPEVEDVEVDINPEDLRVDVFRSSGPGGQSVNTTDSAVRITHLPTGIKAYNLDQVLDGDLGPVVQSALQADEAARLAEAEPG